MKRSTGQDESLLMTHPARHPMRPNALVAPSYDERATMRAWETLLAGDSARAGSRFPVRSLIHDSWSRCATSGINAQQSEAPLENGKDHIELLSRSNGELLAAARRSFLTIGRLLDGTGAMLVLTDALEDGPPHGARAVGHWSGTEPFLAEHAKTLRFL